MVCRPRRSRVTWGQPCSAAAPRRSCRRSPTFLLVREPLAAKESGPGRTSALRVTSKPPVMGSSKNSGSTSGSEAGSDPIAQSRAEKKRPIEAADQCDTTSSELRAKSHAGPGLVVVLRQRIATIQLTCTRSCFENESHERSFLRLLRPSRAAAAPAVWVLGVEGSAERADVRSPRTDRMESLR